MVIGRLLVVSSLSLFAVCAAAGSSKRPASAHVIPEFQKNSHWFTEAEKQIKLKGAVRVHAKNVILFLGDGMGVSTVTAARILEGQLKGMLGEENNLAMDLFPYTGMSKTYNVDAQTPDSAGTMTAIVSGVKTDAGVVGVGENIVRGDCATVTGNELVTILELAELAGKSTGIVTTTRVTHATPAATYAKAADRDWEDNSDMPKSAVAAGCEDIASQLVNFEKNLKTRFPQANNINGIEVVMGGGRRHFLPDNVKFNSSDAISAVEGDRTDGRDLTAEWKAAYPKGVYVFDQSGFDAIDTKKTNRVFGLFNESHMHYEADRGNDISGEPSLTQMTQKAMAILNNNKNGYFLMVEAGRIDHGHHAGSAYSALTETIELSNAVKAAVSASNMDETLIIVTADHSHVFTIAGYPQRGNPILGKLVAIGSKTSALADDGLPYTTLGYANGLGFRNLGETVKDGDASYNALVHTGRVNLTTVNTESSGFHQEAHLPLAAETHGGEDVSIYGQGPGAFLVSGTNEQNVIFHVMNAAADLEQQAVSNLNPPSKNAQQKKKGED